MIHPLVVLAGILGLAMIYFVIPYLLIATAEYREPRHVKCPCTLETARINLDARRAAATSLVRGLPVLKATHCSQWPMEGCRQACLRDMKS